MEATSLLPVAADGRTRRRLIISWLVDGESARQRSTAMASIHSMPKSIKMN